MKSFKAKTSSTSLGSTKSEKASSISKKVTSAKDPFGKYSSEPLDTKVGVPSENAFSAVDVPLRGDGKLAGASGFIQGLGELVLVGKEASTLIHEGTVNAETTEGVDAIPTEVNANEVKTWDLARAQSSSTVIDRWAIDPRGDTIVRLDMVWDYGEYSEEGGSCHLIRNANLTASYNLGDFGQDVLSISVKFAKPFYEELASSLVVANLRAIVTIRVNDIQENHIITLDGLGGGHFELLGGPLEKGSPSKAI